MSAPNARTRLGVALALVMWAIASLPVTAAPAVASSAALAMSARGPEGLELELSIPPVELGILPYEDRSYTSVSVPGLVSGGEPGQPELPLLSARVVVPHGVDVALEVLAEQTETVPLSAPLLPAPRLWSEAGVPGASWMSRYVREEGPAYHQQDTFPADLCRITADDVVREWRLLQISCSPVRYRPKDNLLAVTRSARLALRYPNPASGEPPLSAQAPGPFRDVLAAAVLNPDGLARHRGASSPLVAASLPEPLGRYRLMVPEEGIYGVTYEDLRAAGLDLAGVSSASLRLFQGTQEVAILVQDTDGTFGPGDRFLFYGRQRQSPYGTTNSYLLDWGGPLGLRVQSRPVSAPRGETTYLVADALLRNYDPRYPDPWRSEWADVNLYDPVYSEVAEDGHFYAGSLATVSPADMPDQEWFAASLPAIVGGQGTLSVTLRGTTDSPHLIQFHFGLTSTAESPYSIALPLVAQKRPGATTVAAQSPEPPYTSLGPRTWTGAVPATFNFSVPVTDGLHLLRLTLPGQSDGAAGLIPERAQVVSPRLTYPIGRAVAGSTVGRGQAGSHTYRVAGFGSSDLIVWDVSDPALPVALAGVSAEPAGKGWRAAFADSTGTAATYAITATTALKQVSSVARLSPVALEPAAQYLVVTHPSFVQAAQALAQHRQKASGLTTRVVTTQAIYDRYSSGMLDPEAIRSFVHQAYDSWRDPLGEHLLTYLVLVGDGSYDFKNRLNHGLANYLPPYLGEDFDPNWGGQAASDHLFANRRSAPPSVLVGRIPVRSPAEAMAVVEKVARYENDGLAVWDRALFAADDPDLRDYGTGAPINYGFDEMAESALAVVAADERMAHADLRRVYHSAVETAAPGFYHNESDAGTRALLEVWRAGSLLTYYAGHSQFWGWAFPKLFHSEDIEALGPTPLTVLLSMTCFTGVFYHPNAPSLDEALLLAPDRGTIASLSPLSMGSAAGHRQMQSAVIATLLQGGSIGEAMLAGKLALGPLHRDLVDTYGVLGDPALGLPPTPASTLRWAMLPMVARNAG
ncbi:MAG: hypothetical protein HPY83_14550 [Anaerolineae bacterium]|nr:hypothetical protein [Anaerolineae bacterium]